MVRRLEVFSSFTPYFIAHCSLFLGWFLAPAFLLLRLRRLSLWRRCLWRCAGRLLLRTRLLLAHLLWRCARRLLLWSWLLLAHHRLLLWRGTHGRRTSHLHLALLTL